MSHKLKKGYIQVYTGNGKGKTTAALGLAVRAAGFGLKSFIVQFMKEFPYNEVKSLKLLERWITIEQYGGDKFVYEKKPPTADDLEVANKALQRATDMMLSGDYDIILLDEVCVATYFGLLQPGQVLVFLQKKPQDVEIVLTGRYCPDEIIEVADLVTEMREVKHYYQKGVTARRGIES